MPCLTTAPITAGKPQPDGSRMRWHEFQFTFLYFPGQTLYHDGLRVERDGGGALFFTGDSFTPSGIDDYCLQNRNFVDEGQGYLYCLAVLQHLPRRRLAGEPARWAHVPLLGGAVRAHARGIAEEAGSS